MKKNYITPSIKLANAQFEVIMLNASIDNGQGEGLQHPGDSDDGTIEVGSKNRFYGESDDMWD